MSSGPLTEALAERLNDLYWQSDRTIDEIVGSVGVTRNRLYESVSPLAVGEECPACGGELIFPNRRSRLASTALCSSCGREAIVSIEAESTPARPPSSANGTGLGSSAVERTGWFSDRKRALIGGAAVLGVMMGAAATRVIKE